jgi:phage terminase Nu1 subunit (DNA packaging protein)
VYRLKPVSQLKMPKKSKLKLAPKNKTAPKEEDLPVAGPEGGGEMASLNVEEVLQMRIPVKVGTLAQVTEVPLKSLEGFTREGHLKNEASHDGRSGMGRVYDLLPSMKALIQLYQTRAKRKADAGGELEKEKLLKLAAQRKMEELKLMQAEGEVIQIEFIRQTFSPLFGRIRSNLLALPLKEPMASNHACCCFRHSLRPTEKNWQAHIGDGLSKGHLQRYDSACLHKPT